MILKKRDKHFKSNNCYVLSDMQRFDLTRWKYSTIIIYVDYLKLRSFDMNKFCCVVLFW